MLIIWSSSEGGIKQNYFDSLAKDIVVTYGFEEYKRLELMIKEGLIEPGTGSVFNAMNKSRFNQIATVSICCIGN